jgi:hypothetical protein
LSQGSIAGEPPFATAPPGESGPGLARYATGAIFLEPAIVLIGV